MNANWVNELYIGTEATTATPPVWTYAKLCKGIESMEFNENEQNQQFFFLCGEGFAHNEVTGAAPELVVSGRRIAGDAAQDFVALCKRFLVLSEPRDDAVGHVARLVNPRRYGCIVVGQFGHILGKVVVELFGFIYLGVAEHEALDFKCCLAGWTDGLQHFEFLF